ncbi:hypothetical protein NDU88_006246 [Pleurodeles waltl]|uniref:Uncharacterized protein n=1 Tax=Pleurodeles waltl TaxID=8319 RepID=A0AAV7WZK9_PLEWA|nr:hypothetical protein NDU88_006246 [Pleurodeles waltl]
MDTPVVTGLDLRCNPALMYMWERMRTLGTFGLVPEAGKGNKRAVLEGLLQSRAGRDTEYAVHDLRPLLALLISAMIVVSYL